MASTPISTGTATVTGSPNVEIGLGHFLPGGLLLAPGVRGINETYRGWIEVEQARIAAYVKFLHPWEVFNEVLGSVLCQFVGLPTPPSYVVLVQRDDYSASPIFAQLGTTQALAFGSHAMPMQTLGRRASLTTPAALRELISNWKEWPDVLVFDQWIANPDRHPENLLVGGPGEVHLIDHGLSFHGRNWSPEQLEAAVTIATVRLWTEFLQALVTLPERMEGSQRAQLATAKFSTVDPSTAITSTKVEQLIPPAQLQALAEFLRQRCGNAATVVCNAMGVQHLPL